MEANYSNQRFKKGKVKLIYLMMQQEYTTVSEPESVDGYLGVMVGDSLWYPLWNESAVSEAVDALSGLLNENAKKIEGYVPKFRQTVASSVSGEGARSKDNETSFYVESATEMSSDEKNKYIVLYSAALQLMYSSG